MIKLILDKQIFGFLGHLEPKKWKWKMTLVNDPPKVEFSTFFEPFPKQNSKLNVQVKSLSSGLLNIGY